MSAVMISVREKDSCAIAYLSENPNTDRHHLHGSVSGKSKGDAIEKALRMAHQKSLCPLIFFDENEQKHIDIIPFAEYQWHSVKTLYDMNRDWLLDLDGTIVYSGGSLRVCVLPVGASHGELVDRINEWQHSLLKNL